MAQPVRPTSSELTGAGPSKADDVIGEEAQIPLWPEWNALPLNHRPDICARLYPAAATEERSCMPDGSIYGPLFSTIHNWSLCWRHLKKRQFTYANNFQSADPKQDTGFIELHV